MFELVCGLYNWLCTTIAWVYRAACNYPQLCIPETTTGREVKGTAEGWKNAREKPGNVTKNSFCRTSLFVFGFSHAICFAV